MTLIDKLKARARSKPQRIVLPEGEDARVISAAAAITREGLAKIALLGRKQIVESVAADRGRRCKGCHRRFGGESADRNVRADLL